MKTTVAALRVLTFGQKNDTEILIENGEFKILPRQRMPRIKPNSNAKFDQTECLKLYADGMAISGLGRHFGVSRQAIWAFLKLKGLK